MNRKKKKKKIIYIRALHTSSGLPIFRYLAEHLQPPSLPGKLLLLHQWGLLHRRHPPALSSFTWSSSWVTSPYNQPFSHVCPRDLDNEIRHAIITQGAFISFHIIIIYAWGPFSIGAAFQGSPHLKSTTDTNKKS